MFYIQKCFDFPSVHSCYLQWKCFCCHRKVSEASSLMATWKSCFFSFEMKFNLQMKIQLQSRLMMICAVSNVHFSSPKTRTIFSITRTKRKIAKQILFWRWKKSIYNTYGEEACGFFHADINLFSNCNVETMFFLIQRSAQQCQRMCEIINTFLL